MAKNKKIFTTEAKFNEYLSGGKLTADDICIIQDVKKVYINGIYLDGNEADLSDYLTADEIAAVYATKASLKTVATSGSYSDLSDKPTIPSEVTESTVSGWGFTKNTGTYSKPSGGIPKTDLASAVQTSLDKADTALQSHQDISGKQDKNIYYSGTPSFSWSADSTYSDYGYRGDISVTGVTANMYAEVTFSLADAQSGKYAPICATKAGAVSIWSNDNTDKPSNITLKYSSNYDRKYKCTSCGKWRRK